MVERLYVAQNVPCSNQGILPLIVILTTYSLIGYKPRIYNDLYIKNVI